MMDIYEVKKKKSICRWLQTEVIASGLQALKVAVRGGITLR